MKLKSMTINSKIIINITYVYIQQLKLIVILICVCHCFVHLLDSADIVSFAYVQKAIEEVGLLYL